MTLTDVLALWGATLSTLMVLREFWLVRPKLRVDLAPGVRDDMPEGCAAIRIVNTGARPVMVYHIGITWPVQAPPFWRKAYRYWTTGRRWRLIGWVRGSLPAAYEPTDLPQVMETGVSKMVWIPFSAIDEGMDEPRIVFSVHVQDAFGRIYESNVLNRNKRPEARFYHKMPKVLE